MTPCRDGAMHVGRNRRGAVHRFSDTCAVAAMVLLISTSGTPAQTGGRGSGGEPALQVPTSIFVVDAASLAAEREESRVLDAARDTLGRVGRVLYAPAATRELSLREASLEALQRNLSIRRTRIARRIADQALLEARAVFDPVFAASFNANIRNDFLRVETPDSRFRPATERVERGDLDSKGVFRCTDNAAAFTRGEDAGQACHVITFEPRTPVTTTQFLTAREEGFSPSFPIEANEPSPFQPRHEYVLTGAVNIAQQLPWGSSLNLTVSTRRDHAYYPLGATGSISETFGNYQRPYFTTITLGASVPLPYTRDFGPTATADTNVRLARENTDAAEFDTRAVINSTLLEVDIRYWILVGTLQQLAVTLETLDLAVRQRSVVRRLFDEEFVTRSDLDQAESQVGLIQARLQQLFNNYVVASEALRQILDRDEESLIVPLGYKSILERPIDDSLAPEQVFNNPTVQRQVVAVSIAGILNEQAEAQTRPDLTFFGSATLAQSGTYGYRGLHDSLWAIFEPDFISLTAALEYTYPIGNRGLEAAARGSRHGLAQQQLLLQQVELTVRESFESARATLFSELERVTITQRSVNLAQNLYNRSARLQEEGLTPVYESLRRLITLLDAQVANIQARINARIAESQVLASVGALAGRYAERTAQTDDDRYRLALLREAGILTHFGGPL